MPAAVEHERGRLADLAVRRSVNNESPATGRALKLTPPFRRSTFQRVPRRPGSVPRGAVARNMLHSFRSLRMASLRPSEGLLVLCSKRVMGALMVEYVGWMAQKAGFPHKGYCALRAGR